MPVRKIPKSFRAVTGRFPSILNGRCMSYESKLEHDYFLTLEFDSAVRSYEEQPVKIQRAVNDKGRPYVLDCLVTYKDDRPGLLVELKYAEELKEKAAELEVKFARVREYAAENNLEFRVVTEMDLDKVIHANYLLLYRFAKPPVKINFLRQQIKEVLEATDSIRLKDLLKSFGTDLRVQANYTPAIWHMLYNKEIEADITSPINYDTELRMSNG